MNKIMKLFKIDKENTIVCEYKNTRNAFKHVATLLVNGYERDKVKICYQNRTWESFEFESVIQKLLGKTGILTERKAKNFVDKLAGRNKKEVDKTFGTIATIAKMGEVFYDNQKDKNDWKARMLKAGLENKGLIMPEDWETLSEEDKESRLNGVINELTK